MATVAKLKVLKRIPDGAKIVERDGKRFAKFRDGGRAREIELADEPGMMIGESLCYYGKLKIGTRWERKKLYVDKTASERRLAELQAEADQVDSGVKNPDAEFLKSTPIAALKTQYIEALRRERKKPDHVRISEFMLDRLIELGNWRYFRDITRDNVEAIVAKLEKDGKTPSYQNKFVVRAKAFVHHWLPEKWPDPLKRLKRVSERDAKRTRGRRAATPIQLTALLSADIPEYRKLAYALAGLNGFRRNEVAALNWERVKLNSPIPHVGIARKQGQTDALDYVPLHPYATALLRERMEAMPDGKIVRNVPDVATLEKDWKAVGVTMTDERGLRLDYHALRHTFQTRLDETGCSRATKKRLMRHAAEDVTDGYAHAELAEMAAALKRLPSPKVRQTVTSQAQVKTGTHDTAVVTDHILTKNGAQGCVSVHDYAQPTTSGQGNTGGLQSLASDGGCMVLRDNAGQCLNTSAATANVAVVGPSTQVD